MTELKMRCPACGSVIVLDLTDDDILQIEDFIERNGTYPTYEVTCKKGHKSLVTLAVREKNGTLEAYIKNIAQVLVKPGASGISQKNNLVSWLKYHFSEEE